MTIYEIKKYIFEKNLTTLVLEKIGMHTIYNNGSYVSCAFPDGDNPKGCIVYLNEFLNVTSYTRNINGKFNNLDIIDLINYVCGFNDLHLAINKVKKICNIKYDVSSNNKLKTNYGNDLFKKYINKKEKLDKEVTVYNREILNNYYSRPHINLFYENIFPKTIEYFDVKFDIKENRIVFPHFNLANKNEILALVGRTVNHFYKELNISKYIIIEGVGYKKGNNLYGLAQNIENIKEERKIIIFEAEKSVLKAWQMGYKTGVSVGCHNITKEQIKILLSLSVEEVIIAFDKDVGIEHLIKMTDMLKYYFKVSIIYDKYDILDDKDSPVDKGKKAFDILYKYRNDIEKLRKLVSID